MNRLEKKLSKTVTIKLPVSPESLTKILNAITIPDEYDLFEAFIKKNYSFKGEVNADHFLLKDKRKFGENTGIFINTVEYQGNIKQTTEGIALVLKTKLTTAFLIICLIEAGWLTWVISDLLTKEQLFTALLFVLLYASVLIMFFTLIKSKLESGIDNFIKEISYLVEKEKNLPAE
jgi:hypothetical protein